MSDRIITPDHVILASANQYLSHKVIEMYEKMSRGMVADHKIFIRGVFSTIEDVTPLIVQDSLHDSCKLFPEIVMSNGAQSLQIDTSVDRIWYPSCINGNPKSPELISFKSTYRAYEFYPPVSRYDPPTKQVKAQRVFVTSLLIANNQPLLENTEKAHLLSAINKSAEEYAAQNCYTWKPLAIGDFRNQFT